jgi:hypothetical protein
MAYLFRLWGEQFEGLSHRKQALKVLQVLQANIASVSSNLFYLPVSG